jgi:hypothetical protein
MGFGSLELERRAFSIGREGARGRHLGSEYGASTGHPERFQEHAPAHPTSKLTLETSIRHALLLIAQRAVSG